MVGGESVERMVREMAKTGVGKPEQIKLFYVAMRETILKELLIKRRPVDLGFVTLHAIPFRANWAQFMDLWLNTKYSDLCVSKEKQILWMKQIGFEDRLMDSQLIDMDEKSKTIRWNIVAVTNTGWDQAVQISERNARDAKGEVRYYERVRALISNTYETMVGIYHSWIEKTNHQTASVHEIGPHGHLALRPNSSFRRKYPDTVPRRPGAYSSIPPDAEESGAKLVVPQTAPMLQVSDVQPTITNLRFTGRRGEDGGKD